MGSLVGLGRNFEKKAPGGCPPEPAALRYTAFLPGQVNEYRV